jgi:hypothetical protein
MKYTPILILPPSLHPPYPAISSFSPKIITPLKKEKQNTNSVEKKIDKN